MLNFTKELAQEILDSNNQFPIDFDDAWQWFGCTTKTSAKRNLKRFNEGSDYQTIAVRNPRTGRSIEKVLLTTNCFRVLARVIDPSVGRIVNEYFRECESSN